MDSHVAKALDYQKVAKSHPYYRFNKILPINGSQTTTITAAGGNEIQFEIPVCAFNLAKSYLNFTMVIPNSGTIYNWAFTDVVSPIRQMQLYTRNSISLADLYNVNNMKKIVTKSNTKLDEYLTYDNTTAGLGLNAFVPGTQSTLRRSNVANNVAASSRPYTVAGPAIANSSISYTEPQYIEQGNQGNAGTGAGTMNYNFSIPLSQFKETILSLDKVLYMNEIIVFRIVFDSVSKITYTTTAINDPVTGAATSAVSITLNSIQLYLAVEQDPLIIQGLRQQVASGGFSVLIPYVYCYKNALNGSAQTVSLRFNRGHGRRLQRIYTTSFSGDETLNNTYNCMNFNITNVGPPVLYGNQNGGIISSFYSMLNNQRIQEINLTCSNYDDWNFLQQKLKALYLKTLPFILQLALGR